MFGLWVVTVHEVMVEIKSASNKLILFVQKRKCLNQLILCLSKKRFSSRVSKLDLPPPPKAPFGFSKGMKFWIAGFILFHIISKIWGIIFHDL